MIAIVACASSGGAHGASRCALPQRDSVYAVRTPVYLDCAVDQKAELLTTTVQFEFRPNAAPRPGVQCYSTELEFVVDTLGHPEGGTTRIVFKNDDGFADAVTAVVSQLRYSPALRESKRVRQIVSYKRTAATAMISTKAGSPASPPARVPNC